MFENVFRKMTLFDFLLPESSLQYYELFCDAFCVFVGDYFQSRLNKHFSVAGWLVYMG